MGKRIVSVVLLGLCVLHGLTGCSRKSSGSQSTPKDTVYKWSTCMLEFDKAGFMECLTGSEMELRAAEAFMDYLCATKEFKDAVVDAYGEQGWRAFEEKGGAKLSLNVSDNRDKLDQVQWKVSGDTAEGTMPGESKNIHLTRKDGHWCIHAKDVVTGGTDDLVKFSSMWSRMATLLREKKSRVGQPGVTAETLDKELGAAMLVIILGAG